MKKVYLLSNVVGFKYIAINKVGIAQYEFLYGDLGTTKIFKLEIVEV